MHRYPSLRLRIIASAAILLLLFEAIFCLTLFKRYRDNAYLSEYQKLESDVATLLSLARTENGKIVMPEETPNDEFNAIESDLLGAVLDSNRHLLWTSISAQDENIQIGKKINLSTTPLLNKRLFGITEINGNPFFYFAINHVKSNLNENYYFAALHTKEPFDTKMSKFWTLVIWLGLALLALTILLAISIYWGLSPLRKIDEELDELDQGSRERLSTTHPSEVSGITGEFNALLDRERKQKERYKNTLSDLAHSLKTPVAVLKLLTERPPGDHTTPKREEFIHSCSQQLQQMSAIIQYQLKRAIITTNKKTGNTPFQPYSLLHKLCSNLAKVQESRAIQWHLDCDEKLTLFINRQDFFECVGNLLENAFRLCSSTVYTSLTYTGHCIRVQVEDDGPGVPDDSKERIMQRGIRADRKTPGQGLGLAIIKDIIDEYEGSVTVKDSKLGGALFIISIPVDRTQPQHNPPPR